MARPPFFGGGGEAPTVLSRGTPNGKARGMSDGSIRQIPEAERGEGL